MRGWMAPNRLAVYLVAAVALITGLAGVVGDLEWESIASALGSLAVIGGVVVTWLLGWQKYEERARVGAPVTPAPAPVAELEVPGDRDTVLPEELGTP